MVAEKDGPDKAVQYPQTTDALRWIGVILVCMMVDVLLLGFGVLLLAIWIISSNKPWLRKKLVERYKFALVYDWTLFLAVMIPGWDVLTRHPMYTLPTLIIIGTLVLGEFAIRKETGA